MTFVAPLPRRRIRRSLSLRALPVALGLTGVVLGLVVARLPILWAFLVVAGLALGVAVVVEPLVGVGAALFVGPLRAWLEIRAPGLPSQIGQLVLLATLGAWLARGLWRRDLRLPTPPLALPLVGFLGVALLSLWSPVDPWASFLEFAKWAQVFIVFLLVYDRCTDGAAGWRVALSIAGIAGSAVVQAAIGIWQFGLRADGVENFAIDDRFYRAYGTFQQPNPFAGLMGIVAAFLLGLVMATLVDWWRARASVPLWLWGAAAAAGVVVAGLLASWSRGGWMGFGAALLAMTIFLPRRGIWGAVLVVAVLLAGTSLYATGRLPAPIVNRLTGFLAYTRFEHVRGVAVTDATYAVIERMAHWQAGFGMWRANFWLGVGLGGYEAAYSDYALINWPLALGHAHNYYFNLVAETGTLGLLAFLIWLGTVYVRLILTSWRLRGWCRGVALGLIGSWSHFAVHSLVDVLIVNNVHLHLAVLLGLSAWAVAEKSSKFS